MRPPARSRAVAADASPLLARAEAARAAGDRPAAIALLAQAADLHLTTGAAVPRGLFHDLGALLFQAGEAREGERRTRQGLTRLPGDFALTNLLGVLLKAQGRTDEALASFDEASRVNPAHPSPWVNRGNILLGRNAVAAVAAFARAVQADPSQAENTRLLGVAQRQAGQTEAALASFAAARRLAPAALRAWIDTAGLLDELGRSADALAAIDEALAANPDSRLLVEARFALLRRAGRQDEAVAYAAALLKRLPDAAWVHIQAARNVVHSDRRAANRHLEEAVRLEPDNADALTDLADSLDRTRGPDEGKNIEAAYKLALRRVDLGGPMLGHARSITSILNRACDFAASARVGSFEALTRHWADTGYISALHYQMAQVTTMDQRLLLRDAHAQWGRTVDALAARAPLARPAIRRGRAKIRLGLMSSDLRNHPVSYFAMPLIDGYDRDRFELYCYSWNSGAGDPVQARIAAAVDAWRLAPAISDRDAAAMIAADQLDMLIELGGTTYMNKLNVMAYKPARVQASWLGYPHSAGPRSIDYILVDPHNRPTDDALLIEKPLELARSWVVLGDLGFNEAIAITPGTPEQRSGHLTFGTMNNPYKFTPAVLATWARATAAVPGAHFLFVRPEAGHAAFQANIREAFAEAGVTPDRLEFEAVRGTHMPHYNRIDVALDTFPQTGGTTTCEALWMGVPTISLAGPCFFERLSRSNLINAGLGDLVAETPDDFHAKALALAADAPRCAALRTSLRADIRARPLGRPDWFVTDFQSAVTRAVDAA